jgi:hypothetical protein
LEGSLFKMKAAALLFVSLGMIPVIAPGQTSFSNTNPVSLPSTTDQVSPKAASPYPSTITVSGLSGTISKVTLTLNNWNEAAATAFPGDRDFLLVGPTGGTFEFLGGVGGFHGFSNLNLTLDDSAANALSSAQLVSGTFRPTNRNTGFCTNFLGPAPASANCASPNGTTTFASVFNGGNPNGTWSLYAMNIGTGDPAGTVSGGWTLTITVAAAANTRTTPLR